MILDNLLNGVQQVDALQRLNAVIVLGTVDEIEAIPTLIEVFKAEREPDVKQALAWAGKRLQEARQSGYSTLEAIFKQFRIDRALAEAEDERERRLMEQMKFKADMEHIQRQDDNLKQSLANTAVSTALFGISGFMSGMGSSSPSGANFISSNLDSNRPQHGAQRIMPTRPSDGDIRVYVRRLREEKDAAKRVGAAQSLSRLVNNPEALPDLAAAFIDDKSDAVKEAAQQAAKEIYWNAVYWEMEQDGRMKAEIERRGGKADTSSAPQTPAQSEPTPSLPPKPKPADIASILKKAEAQREKRKRF
ncbi:MAG: hypothetical protein GC179_07150 [Anaerolineaceae bacterium]|nr:hypothetical protein [Anaerolineaceae bacterium]